MIFNRKIRVTAQLSDRYKVNVNSVQNPISNYVAIIKENNEVRFVIFSE